MDVDHTGPVGPRRLAHRTIAELLALHSATPTRRYAVTVSRPGRPKTTIRLLAKSTIDAMRVVARPDSDGQNQVVVKAAGSWTENASFRLADGSVIAVDLVPAFSR